MRTLAWTETSEMDSPPLQNATDLDLVRQTRDGNPEAYSELVRRHERMVYNLAFRFMRAPEAAEDMAQEAFLKAYRLLKSFRGDASFSTWLYRVTASVCLTELKRRKRGNETALDQVHREPSVEPKTEERDLHARIRQCVTLLPDRYATIMTLYYLKGVAYEDIAESLGIPLGTLKTWMFRARAKLRKIVEKELQEDAR